MREDEYMEWDFVGEKPESEYMSIVVPEKIDREKLVFSKFRGSIINTYLGMLYILNSTNSGCFPFENIQNLSVYETEIIWTKNNNGSRILSIPNDIKKNVMKCFSYESVKFVFIFLGMNYSTPQSNGKNDWHSNILIIMKNHDTYEIERFEPYGGNTNSYDEKFLDNILKSYFEKMFGKVKYFVPSSFCPKGIFQSKEKITNFLDPEGFCVAWSLWYLNNRLQYPDLSREQVVKKFVDFNDIKYFISNLMANYLSMYEKDFLKNYVTINYLDLDKYLNQEVAGKIGDVIVSGILLRVNNHYAVLDEYHKYHNFNVNDVKNNKVYIAQLSGDQFIKWLNHELYKYKNRLFQKNI